MFCIKCGSQLGDAAKSCPQCGQQVAPLPSISTPAIPPLPQSHDRAPGMGVGFLLILAALAVLVLIGVVVNSGGKTSASPNRPSNSGSVSLANAEMPYEVITVDDFSIPGQRRMSYVILADKAVSFEQRALTARRAAFDLQTRSKADRVVVLLEADKSIAGMGSALAVAEVKDKSLTQLDATAGTYTAHDVEVMGTFRQLQKQFENDETDARQFAAVGRILHITPDAVRRSVMVIVNLAATRKPYTSNSPSESINEAGTHGSPREPANNTENNVTTQPQTGQMVIKPQFDIASPFSEGLAAVRVAGESLSGYINKQGKFVINPKFEFAGQFSEGLAEVGVGPFGTRKYGYIDKQAKVVIALRFSSADRFSEGLAAVQTGELRTGKYGFIDKQGRFVVSPHFENAKSFSEGLAAVQTGSFGTGKWGYVNTQGKFIIIPQFADTSAFSEGLAAVRIDGLPTGKWGNINKLSEFVLAPQFTSAEPFHESVAAVCIGKNAATDKCGYIDKRGGFVVNALFDYAGPFSEGLAAVRIGDATSGKWGYINKQGKFVVAPQFQKAGPFSESFAPVRIGDYITGKGGYIAR